MITDRELVTSYLLPVYIPQTGGGEHLVDYIYNIDERTGLIYLTCLETGKRANTAVEDINSWIVQLIESGCRIGEIQSPLEWEREDEGRGCIRTPRKRRIVA